MADETPAAVPAAPVAPAVVETAPVPVPDAGAPSAPAGAPQPAADGGAPVVDIPAVVEPEAPADPTAGAHAPGLLSVTEPEKKPAEEPKADPAAPAPEAKEAAVAPTAEPLSYSEHPLTLPDGVTLEDARLGEYDAILGAHRIPAEARQQLADLYAGDVQTMLQQVRRDQYTTWEDTRKTWREDCAVDPDFGGSRFDTSKAAAIRMIEFVIPPAERKDWNEAAAATGWADHPVMFRFLNRLAQRFDEPAHQPANIRPAPPQAGTQPRSLRSFYRSSNRG